MPRIQFNRYATEGDVMERPAPAVRPVDRERPPITRHSAHTSREAAETRVDMHPEFDVNRIFNPTSLEAPPPRTGYGQRWIADWTSPNATKEEKLNWYRKQKQGWAMRDPETVPPSLRNLYPSVKLQDGAAAIAIAGMVLCEMPVQVIEQRRLAINDRISHLNQAIPESTQELMRRGEGRFGPVQQDDNHRSYRGRSPGIMS
jgi:hypothetical protein